MTAVKDYWDEQARAFGASDRATAPDSYYRQAEIKQIIPFIIGQDVIDIGCGNGYSTRQFAEAHPEKQFTGVDFSPEMIAKTHPGVNHTYRVGDVRSLTSLGILADTIVSERCLINLSSWQEQEHALLEMSKCLRKSGRIVLAENFTRGLMHLNDLRLRFGLPEIKQRWHNHYIDDDDFYDFCSRHFVIEYKANIGNMHYIVSRVVYAALAKQANEDIRYDHPINRIASELPHLGEYDYSPNWLIVLRTKWAMT